MATNSKVLISTLTIAAAMVFALPVAKAIDTATSASAPLSVNVNRAAKSDQLAAPRPAIRPMPVQVIRKPASDHRKQQIMDGCDPMFSPVTVPAMAHVTGRCVG